MPCMSDDYADIVYKSAQNLVKYLASHEKGTVLEIGSGSGQVRALETMTRCKNVPTIPSSLSILLTRCDSPHLQQHIAHFAKLLPKLCFVATEYNGHPNP